MPLHAPTIITALDRRSDLLLQRLTKMKRHNAHSAIIDVKAETLDPTITWSSPPESQSAQCASEHRPAQPCGKRRYGGMR
jgi:hypothetical protein